MIIKVITIVMPIPVIIMIMILQCTKSYVPIM